LFLYILYLFNNSKNNKVYKAVELFLIRGNKVGVSGSLYFAGKRKYLALYSSSYSDIYIANPSDNEEKSKRLAHISYGFESRRWGIDVFQVRGDDFSSLLNNVNLKRSIGYNKEELKALNEKNINKSQGICYELISDIKNSDIEKEILYFAQKDIGDFCRKEANSKETKKDYFNKIIPKTKLKFIDPKYYLQGGKQEFVPSCRLEANLDFSNGCISSFIPIEFKHESEKGFMYGFIDFSSECAYCYSKYQHRYFPKSILTIDKEKLKNELEGNCYLDRKNKLGKKVKVLRLGKRTEPGSKYTLEQLVTTLETCLETGTQVVMPTKYLEFNDEIAGLFKKTKSSLIYSIGWDKFEKGACSNGCNNEFRIEQAKRYRKTDVNSIFYLLIDAVNPPGDREKEILDIAKENKISILLLPIRLNNKSIAFDVTGLPWNNLKMKNQLMIPGISKEMAGNYKLINSHTLIAEKINQEWTKLVGNNNGNIRMCNHNEDKTWCGACFLEGKKGIIKKNNDHSLSNVKKVLF